MGLQPDGFPGIQLGIIAAIVVALVVVRWLERTTDWGNRRRKRFLLGVPWGTLVTAAGVVAVYLFVQGGLDRWHAPVVVAFRSWSYLYPLGMALAPFAHSGPGHLIGNLIGAIVLGSVAEYAWGHFPSDRGSTTFASARTNPYVRAFVFFPVGVLIVGLTTSLLSWGPVIGFSGVVFAFAGFALVRYPIWTVIAIEANGFVRLLYRTLRDPIVLAQTDPQLVQPWWAGIAVQSHLAGLFIGIVCGAVLLPRRDRADPSRLFVGALLVSVSLSIWAVWWFRGGERYVLYRGVGVALVVLLALLVTIGLRTADLDRSVVFNVPARQVGILVLVFPLLVVGSVAVPVNLNAVADTDTPGDAPAIDVRDYTVTYAENVTNRQTSVVNVSVLGERTTVEASGVIVVSGQRQVWTQAVSATRLRFAGSTGVHLGGIGWRETVVVARSGWTVPENGTAYRVRLRRADGDWQLVHRSATAMAEPILQDRRVSVRPTETGFALEVHRNGTVIDRGQLPAANETVSVGGLGFVREAGSIYATYDGTRVRIAREETYQGG